MEWYDVRIAALSRERTNLSDHRGTTFAASSGRYGSDG